MPDKQTKKKINPFTVFETIFRWIGFVGGFLLLGFVFVFIPIWNAVHGEDWWQIFGLYIIFGGAILFYFITTIVFLLIENAYTAMKNNWYRRNYESNNNE